MATAWQPSCPCTHEQVRSGGESAGFGVETPAPRADKCRRVATSVWIPTRVMTKSGDAISVLHVIHELGDGGADRALCRIVNASDPIRVRHTILSLRRGRGYGALKRSVRILYATGGERGRTRTLGVLLRRRFDVVHGWTPQASIVAAQIASVSGLPLVQRQPVNIELEREYESAFTASYWRELCLAHQAADAVIVPSPALVESTRRLCGVASPVVIANGIDVDRAPMWHPRPRADRRVEFGLIGRLCKQKDPMTVIEALTDLPPSLNWRLRIFGDGYLRQPAEARVNALGLRSRVRFEGFDREWVSAGIDVFVFPTRYEGMSNALLEAAAAGMPIVATAIPENEAVLEHGTHALLVPPGNARCLARAMSRLAEDRAFATRMGARARERMRRFSFEAVVSAHEAIYIQLARPVAHTIAPHAA
jgi:glycosyltransferase involved in cell wall biosynthesis